MLLLMLGSFLLLEKRKDSLAGALVALTLFKFHLLLALPIAMLVKKRWRMALGYAVVATVEVALSVALVGMEGVKQYIALLTRKDLETLSPSPEMMINMKALATNLGSSTFWLEGLLIVTVLGIVIVCALKACEDKVWFWAAVAGSLLIAPHTYEYDAAMLLPAGLLVVFSSAPKALRATAVIILMPAPYLLTLLHKPWAAGPSIALAGFLICLAMANRLKIPGDTQARPA
jgi:hypothetical protein